MPLLFVFIILPIIEVFLLIKIGAVIGGGSVILIMLATAISGIVLIRKQGRATIDRLRYHVENRQLPVFDIFEGLCLFVAGILLVIPGFFTDVAALLLCIPLLRLRIFNQIRPWVKTGQDDFYKQEDHGVFTQEYFEREKRYTTPPVIEGDYKDVTADDAVTKKNNTDK